MRLGSAPVTWGVSELSTSDARQLAPDELLAEISGLGYRAVELGPRGYLGGTPGEVTERLRAHRLALAGAFVPLQLADEAAFRSDLEELELTLAVLATAEDAPAVLADAGSPARMTAAGRPSEVRRTALDSDRFKAAVDRLRRAAERCSARGVRAVFHPHAGSHVESAAEVAALLELTEPELLGLCLDTGHCVLGGGDVLALARDSATRIAHVHLKDVDGALLESLRAGTIGVREAWARGLFAPLGEGVVDVEAFLALPELRGFGGWLIVEQDRLALSAGGLDAVRAVEEANRAKALQWWRPEEFGNSGRRSRPEEG